MGFIKTPADLMETLNGFRLSRVILTAFELDIFSKIGEENKTAKEIANEIKADERATDRLLNVLAGIGLLEKSKISSSPKRRNG